MNLDLSKLEHSVAEKMAECCVPSMAITAVRGDEAIYTKCFGYKDLENELPPDENTVYAIASLTKAMTATCVGMLVDEGKLSWDVPIVHYLPEFRMYDEFAGQNMTLRDMLSHNTGLPRHDLIWYSKEGCSSTKELVEGIRYLKPNKSFRSLYEYNNLMFTTAGYVIERLTGISWADFIKERLFKPLGMNSSSTVIEGLSKALNKALPYKPGKDFPHNKPVLTEYLDFNGMAACGTVNSTINDMAKWAAMNLKKGTYKDKTIISEKTLKEIHTPHTVQRLSAPIEEVPINCYGLGWGTRVYRGHYNITHSGGIDGFSTYISLLPYNDIGIVILTNMDNAFVHFAVANTFKDYILGLPEKDWLAHMKAERGKLLAEADKKNKAIIAARKPDTSPSKKLEDYVGLYKHKAYGKISVTLKGGKLHLSYQGLACDLTHNNYDTFDTDLLGDYIKTLILVRFTLDNEGNVSELHAELEVAMNGEFIVFNKLD